MAANPTSPPPSYAAAESEIWQRQRTRLRPRNDALYREVLALERFLLYRATTTDFEPIEAHERPAPADDEERRPTAKLRGDAAYVNPLLARIARQEDEIREGLAAGLYLFEITDEWWRHWRFALSRLPSAEQIKVVLWFLGGGQTREMVAERLGCHESTVTTLKKRALTAMVHCLHAVRAGKLKPVRANITAR